MSSLVTRCPHCATAFKVVADQLRIRNGLVRCGVCNTVFDGRACLVTPGEQDPAGRPPLPVVEQAVPPWEDTPPIAPAPAVPVASPAAPAPAAPVYVPPVHPAFEPPPPPAPIATPVTPPAVLRGRESMRVQDEPPADRRDEDDEFADERDEPEIRDLPADLPGIRQEPEWTIRAEPQVWRQGPREPAISARSPVASEPEFHVGDEHDDEHDAPDAVHGEMRTRYSSATDSGRTPPEFMDGDRERSRGVGRALWTTACLIALLALALQLVYVYRSSIATSVPFLRPVLELACRGLNCTVGYPRRLERIGIISSSLRTPQGAQASAAEGQSHMVLNVVMRNRFDKPQPWPALVLELTDISDTVVARKVLMPQDYLKADQARGPFGAAAEVTLSVPVDIQGINVNGYQLDKFFP